VPRIGFFAARPIDTGEELSISYGSVSQVGGSTVGITGGAGRVGGGSRECRCGAVECCGVLPFDE